MLAEESLSLRTRLPKSFRLKDRRDFLRVQKLGKKKYSTHFIVAHLVPPPRFAPRFRVALGITVSKKVGNAPLRNRIKRLVREIYRKKRERFPDGHIVVIAKKEAATLSSYAACEESLMAAISRLRA